MGTMQHHAIIMTSCNDELLDEAHTVAIWLFSNVAPVSTLTAKVINGYRSFAIFPDGSKEGWMPSKNGDEAREKFSEWVEDQAYEDGGELPVLYRSHLRRAQVRDSLED